MLAEVASEEEPDGQHEKPAAEANGEPDEATALPRNDAAMEEAPGAGAGTGAVSVTPSGESFDTETGEIVEPASDAGEPESHDDDLGLEDGKTAREPGPEPGADDGAQGVDPSMIEDIVGGTIAGVRDSPRRDYADPAPPAAEAAARPAGNAGEPPAVRQGGNGDGFPGQDRQEGGDIRGAREHEVLEEDGRPEPVSPAGAEAAGPESSMRSGVVKVTKAVAGAVGKVADGVTGLVRKGAAEKPAGARVEEGTREPEAGGKSPPEPPSGREEAPPAEERVDHERIAEAAARAARKTEDAEASGQKTRAASEVSDETAAAFARNLDRMRGQLDRMDNLTANLGPRLDAFTTAVSVSTRDFRQRKRRWIRPVLAAVLAAPLVFAGGAALQSRLPLLPQADPTLGWKDHFWVHYGEAFKGCFEKARNEESGRAKCEIEVRAR